MSFFTKLSDAEVRSRSVSPARPRASDNKSPSKSKSPSAAAIPPKKGAKKAAASKSPVEKKVAAKP